MEESAYSEIGFKGKYIRVRSRRVNGLTIVIRGDFLKKASLHEEEYQDVCDPSNVIKSLSAISNKPDIFTFKQRYPDIVPHYGYHIEQEEIAVLPISSIDDWQNNRISNNTKRAIAKAKKNGVQIRLVNFDRAFIEGMKTIFDESPVRQRKPFWHYGKDLLTIEKEFSKFLFREDIIGAYLHENLVGFIFLAYTGRYAMPTQILSSLAHRDKGVVSALLAKAIEICVEKQIPYIIYGDWQESSLTEFKRRNGFIKAHIPRYYVSLTLRGKLAINLGLHHRLPQLLPAPLRRFLLRLRSAWSNLKKRV